VADTCGVCGGEVAIREVPGGRDWRHLEPAWHRPKLGTPLTPEHEREVFAVIRASRTAALEAKRKVIKPPPPEPLQRATETDELPRSAAGMRNAAAKAGWTVKAELAIGPWLAADGTTATRIVHSWVLKFSRSAAFTQHAVASWVDGSDPLESPGFDGAYILTPVLTSVGSADLRAYLESDMPCLTHARLTSRLHRTESDLHKLAKRASSGNPPKDLPEQIVKTKASIAELKALIEQHGPDTCETCAEMGVTA